MDFYDNRRIVLILCGLIGSGKSTLALAIQSYYPQFVRCNQDDLGDRKAVERAVKDALDAGKSVIVDRTNFDCSQRRTWIGIGRQYPNVSVWILHLDVPRNVCLDRLEEREDHPTIKDFETAQMVIRTLQNSWEDPCICEGVDLAVALPANSFLQAEHQVPQDNSSPSVYSSDDIEALLLAFIALARSPDDSDRAPLRRIVCTHPDGRRPTPQHFSSRGRGGHRGRGGDRWRDSRGGSSGRGLRNSRGGDRGGYSRPRPMDIESGSWR